MTTDDWVGRRSALIVGHPGHELRVWGWMRAVTPVVAVLTDGSGHDGRSRVELSREVCRRAAARISDWFGMATDQEIYRAILQRDVYLFLRMSDVLAKMLADHEIDCVAGDATEGYNPTHDLCRLVIDRAVRMTSGVRRIDNYEFSLVGKPGPEVSRDGVLRIDLSPVELALKIDVCRGYAAAAGGTLAAEVDAMLREHGEAGFAREYLLPVDARPSVEHAAAYQPFYETHGEKQVAVGHYAFVIRLHEHVSPIARALRT